MSGDRDTEILKNLKLDFDSWHGIQKKELQLKLKECIDFLKVNNISSPDHMMVPFIKQYLDKINNLEEEAFFKTNIMRSMSINNKIEEHNEYLKKNIDYNKRILGRKQISSLKNDLEFLSLDTNEEIYMPVRELSELNFERINKLLEVIEEQEKTIHALKIKKNELSH